MEIETSPTQQRDNDSMLSEETEVKFELPLLDNQNETIVATTSLSRDDISKVTRSTAEMSGSGGWSSSTLTLASDVVMEPLNDLGGESSHSQSSRWSNPNSLGASSNHSRRSQSNSLGGSSNHTHGSCDRSLGESSLSSFLSVLLEEEETRPHQISIVSDNPRPERKSIQELRLSFIRSAYKNDKPKCRWEYLTRDNNDREQLSMSKRRSKLEVRSSSFSGAISNTKQKISSVSLTSSPKETFTDKDGRKNAAKMFLRMPQRKNSPMNEAVQKKSIMSRCFNMSDTDLIILPMQPGSITPKKKAASSSFLSESEPKGLSRSGDHEANTGNATWSKTDLRERRRRNSNQFLDFLLESDAAAKSCWPSPLPSPSPSPLLTSNAFKLSQNQLADLSSSFYSLDDSSYEEDELDKESNEATTPPLERLSIHKPLRRSHSASATVSRQRQKEQKGCTRPPQIPTRYRSLYSPSPRKSPRQKAPQMKPPPPPTPPPPPPPLIQARPNFVLSPTAKSPPPVSLRKKSKKQSNE